jgi:16S rRNA (adenine1518-N6/adenine1519-N6)-dimethyltransferase
MSTFPKKTVTTLRENRLSPKKKFGQNFLVNAGTAEAIVRAGDVKLNETVIEVGVGLGALTLPLSRAAGNVVGFEIDSGIVRYHAQEKDLPGNVTLVHQDILTADFEEIVSLYGGPLKIIANLPYSISNPFVFKLIDNCTRISTATVMLQKEVGERLLAMPGSKDYGVPTVLLNSCAVVEKIMTLRPAEFHPRPKVDSVVVRIDFSKNCVDASLHGLPYDRSLLKKIVKTSFGQRRKTLLNSLGSGNFFGLASRDERLLSKEMIAGTIQAADVSPQVRPEKLSVNDFIRLTVELEKTIKRH